MVILGRWFWLMAASALVAVGAVLLVAEPLARRTVRAAEVEL